MFKLELFSGISKTVMIMPYMKMQCLAYTLMYSAKQYSMASVSILLRLII